MVEWNGGGREGGREAYYYQQPTIDVQEVGTELRKNERTEAPRGADGLEYTDFFFINLGNCQVFIHGQG